VVYPHDLRPYYEALVWFMILLQLLHFNLVDAAKTISLISGKTERTTVYVRMESYFSCEQWHFLAVKYQRSRVLWYNEDLNKQATKYVR